MEVLQEYEPEFQSDWCPDIGDVRRTLRESRAKQLERGPGSSFGRESRHHILCGRNDSSQRAVDGDTPVVEDYEVHIDTVRKRTPVVSFSRLPQRPETTDNEEPERQIPILDVERGLRAVEQSSRSAGFARCVGREQRTHRGEDDGRDDTRERMRRAYLDQLDLAAAYAQTLPRKAVAQFTSSKRFGSDGEGHGQKSEKVDKAAFLLSKDASCHTLSRSGNAADFTTLRPRTRSYKFTPEPKFGAADRNAGVPIRRGCERPQAELHPNFDAVRSTPSACTIGRRRLNAQSQQASVSGRNSRLAVYSAPGPGTYEVHEHESISRRCRGRSAKSQSQSPPSASRALGAATVAAVLSARRPELNVAEASMKLKKRTPSYCFTPAQTQTSRRQRKPSSDGPKNKVADVVVDDDAESNAEPVQEQVLVLNFGAVERRVRGGAWAKPAGGGARTSTPKAPPPAQSHRAAGATAPGCEATVAREDRKAGDVAIIMDASEADAFTRRSRCSWTFSRTPRDPGASSRASEKASVDRRDDLDVSLSLVRPRSQIAVFSRPDGRSDDLIVRDSDSLFQALRKLVVKSRRAEECTGGDAPGPAQLSRNVLSSWCSLQRHVPAAVWSTASARWREDTRRTGTTGSEAIRDRLYELASAMKLTRPSPQVCVINPLPHTRSHQDTHRSGTGGPVARAQTLTPQLELHRARLLREEDTRTDFYEVNLDSVRARTSTGTSTVTAFARQIGRDSKHHHAGGCAEVGVGHYEPSYGAVEVRVKGSVPFNLQLAPNATTTANDGDGGDAVAHDGDILALDVCSAKDFTLPNPREPVHAVFVRAQATGDTDVDGGGLSDLADLREMFATSVAHGGDEVIRRRLQAGVEMARQTGKETRRGATEADGDDVIEIGPGAYNALDSWALMQPSLPSWTFGKEDVNASHEVSLEGDKCDIDVDSASKASSTYARSASAMIMPEHFSRSLATVDESAPSCDYYNAEKPRKRQPMLVNYSTMLARPTAPECNDTDANRPFIDDEHSGPSHEYGEKQSSWPPLAPANKGYTFAKSALCTTTTDATSIDMRPELDITSGYKATRPDHVDGSHRARGKEYQLLGLTGGHEDASELDRDRLTSWVPFLGDDYDEGLRPRVPAPTYREETSVSLSKGDRDAFDVDIGGLDAGCYDPCFASHLTREGEGVLRWGDGPVPQPSSASDAVMPTRRAKVTEIAPASGDAIASCAETPRRTSSTAAGEASGKAADSTEASAVPLTPARRTKMIQKAIQKGLKKTPGGSAR